MTQTYDLIVRGGEVANHAGRGKADVGVIDGRIAFIGDLSQASAGEVFDATGLTVLPGVIDTQVHFREPGLDWKEDLERGLGVSGLIVDGAHHSIIESEGGHIDFAPADDTEAEILRLLASGLTDPAIATTLFISVRTVENHVARIFAKLGVRTRRELATLSVPSTSPSR